MCAFVSFTIRVLDVLEILLVTITDRYVKVKPKSVVPHDWLFNTGSTVCRPPVSQIKSEIYKKV